MPSAEGGNARCVRDGKALPHPDEGVDGNRRRRHAQQWGLNGPQDRRQDGVSVLPPPPTLHWRRRPTHLGERRNESRWVRKEVKLSLFTSNVIYVYVCT